MDFLPICKQDMLERGIAQFDFVYVIGDLNKRRGRVMGMNPNADGDTVVEAEVPMAEMSSYTIDLRAMTQARGSFTLEFARYEEVPKVNQAKIIEDAKNNEE